MSIEIEFTDCYQSNAQVWTNCKLSYTDGKYFYITGTFKSSTTFNMQIEIKKVKEKLSKESWTPSDRVEIGRDAKGWMWRKGVGVEQKKIFCICPWDFDKGKNLTSKGLCIQVELLEEFLTNCEDILTKPLTKEEEASIQQQQLLDKFWDIVD